MNVLLLGATGMVGQGVLRECLLDSSIHRVVSLGRNALEPSPNTSSTKLHEIVHPDLWNLAPVTSDLSQIDACFFCLGVSSFRMTEERYTRITYDLTLSIANALRTLNPGMTFIYVSGQSTDSSEQGRVMWARVKGRTENALLALFGQAAYMFRPGIIVPLHGIRSKTRLYRAIYTIMPPLYPLIRALAPHSITITEQVGRAMIRVAKHGFAGHVLETPDINSL